MKLLLFDIDGTLLKGGPAKASFGIALEEVYGTMGPIGDHDFSGKTDPQIARELLTRAGFGEVIEERFERLWDCYLDEVKARSASEPVSVLPAVPQLLAELAERSSAAMGLVTGNIARGAALKLECAGLQDFFPIGAYGSDHEERNELPTVAIRRAEDHFGHAFSGTDVVVIGDTPRDVECGEVVGATTIAVATGNWSADQLRDTGADVVFSDFTDVGEVLDALLS